MKNELIIQEQELSPEEIGKIESYKEAIDFSKPDKITGYGAPVQNRLNTFADGLLNVVRSKDMGEIGTLLSSLVVDIKRFDGATAPKTGLLGLFDNLKRQLKRIKAEYNKVETNIASIEGQLEKHCSTLQKDIYVFNKQYDENWTYFREISILIAAGEDKILQMHNEVLPQMKQQAEESQDQREAMRYNDIEQQVARFEKKVHDLKLSRMISVQMAPQIRMVQNNCATMVDKIQSTIMNTLPLWKNQMVLSLGLVHTQQALHAQKTVTDATNELLKRNSEMLKQSTGQIARESERGIVDIETIKKANADLFVAMEDMLRIQQEGRENRKLVEVELLAAEEELKTRLLGAKNN